jgi:hypothetical protein
MIQLINICLQQTSKYGLNLDHLEHHAIPSFVIDVVLKSSGELLL